MGKHRLRVFKNGLLRRTVESKREDATGVWRRLNSEKLDDLCSQNIIWVITSRRKRREVHTGLSLENGRGTDHWKTEVWVGG
jgi:hypothetical protein